MDLSKLKYDDVKSYDDYNFNLNLLIIMYIKHLRFCKIMYHKYKVCNNAKSYIKQRFCISNSIDGLIYYKHCIYAYIFTNLFEKFVKKCHINEDKNRGYYYKEYSREKEETLFISNFSSEYNIYKTLIKKLEKKSFRYI